MKISNACQKEFGEPICAGKGILTVKSFISIGEPKMTEPKLIQHHEKYLEIHGEDKVKLLTWSEHTKLHRKLRKENNCKIPVCILDKISQKAHKRISRTIVFQEAVLRNVLLVEEIKINKFSNELSVCSYFRVRSEHRRIIDKPYEAIRPKKLFRRTIDTNIILFEDIGYNYHTENIDVSSGFSSRRGVKLCRIREE